MLFVWIKLMDDTLSQIKSFYPEAINIEHKMYKLNKDDKNPKRC